ncbi:hypothetical protein DFJ74DRAFT_653047 [Hyaloraphidium curvatum]|nr:hypothetical protein DFJ74DRAFT_653047 [Hyaloraphidium curvatum]
MGVPARGGPEVISGVDEAQAGGELGGHDGELAGAGVEEDELDAGAAVAVVDDVLQENGKDSLLAGAVVALGLVPGVGVAAGGRQRGQGLGVVGNPAMLGVELSMSSAVRSIGGALAGVALQGREQVRDGQALKEGRVRRPHLDVRQPLEELVVRSMARVGRLRRRRGCRGPIGRQQGLQRLGRGAALGALAEQRGERRRAHG